MSCLRSSLRFGFPLTCRSTMRFPRAGRVSLAAVGSIAVALAAAACSSGGSTTPATAAAHLETTNVVVGALPVVDSAGLYLAQQQGYFKQEGLHVTISPIAASPDAIPEMKSGGWTSWPG